MSSAADPHDAAVDQHDVTLDVAETDRRCPGEIVFGEVKLLHFAFGKTLEKICPDEAGPSVLACGQAAWASEGRRSLRWQIASRYWAQKWSGSRDRTRRNAWMAFL